MRRPILGLLRLARIQNLPTAVGDAWAGYGLAAALAPGSDPAPVRTVTLLSLASLLAYAGGCCLNDLADLHRDRRLHPERPLPAAEVTPGSALSFLVFLFLGAMLAAQGVGVEAAAIALILLLGIVLYDALFKLWRLPGAACMGALRALNLLLGMSPFIPRVWADGSLLVLPLLLGAHVACVTYASTFEEGNPRARGFRAAVALDVALVLLATFWGPRWLAPLATGLPLAGALALRGVEAVRERQKNLTAEVVKAGVVGIVLLDATFLLSHGATGWAAAVVALLLPRVVLAFVFEGT